jgi:hypothetical protein
MVWMKRSALPFVLGGLCLNVLEAELLAGLAEGSREIARAVIGQIRFTSSSTSRPSIGTIYERQTRSRACSRSSHGAHEGIAVGDNREVDGFQAGHRSRENLAAIERRKPVAESRSRRQIPEWHRGH